MTSLSVSHLTVNFGSRTVISDLSFELRQGEIASLLGPSGCGKTTLLRAIAGLIQPASGAIRFGSQLVGVSSVVLPPHKRGTGYVPQQGALFPHLTVAKNIASHNGGKVEVTHDPESAAKDASVLYTDVWMSMGDSEADRAEKMPALSPFAVTENLMKLTSKDSLFMHCLPAHRGEEVEASVIDGPRSVVWREAYHRRTTIQSILYHLIKGDLKGSTH